MSTDLSKSKGRFNTWLMEKSRLLPLSAHLHEFDINVAQLPPKQLLPVSVRGFKCDAFSNVRHDLVETFAVIHIAIVVLIANHTTVLQLLRDLLRLLSLP